jgi:hypothetical protein
MIKKMKSYTREGHRRETITMYKSNAGWMARFSDPEVLSLFGTDKLPTAFTVQASKEEVVTTMQALNPDALVGALVVVS